MSYLNSYRLSTIDFYLILATLALFFSPVATAKGDRNSESIEISVPPAREYCSSSSEESTTEEISQSSNRLPVPNVPIPNGTLTLEEFVGEQASDREILYRVIVRSSDKDLVRSLYPDAFTIVHQGQTVLQAGLFRSRYNAEEARASLKNLGLDAAIVD